jgi:glycosyltransferase involved in cell wall biosynthesis
VSEEDKYALLEAADVLVLPSHLESLGIVLLEAWQVGTPCLVSA